MRTIKINSFTVLLEIFDLESKRNVYFIVQYRKENKYWSSGICHGFDRDNLWAIISKDNDLNETRSETCNFIKSIIKTKYTIENIEQSILKVFNL